MSEINVSLEGIEQYQKLILESKRSVNMLLYRILSKVKNANITWDDRNYQKLEKISVECVGELKQIYEIILEAEKYLNYLNAIISEYEENIDFKEKLEYYTQSNSSKNEQKKINILKKGLIDIDLVLQGYKKELLKRGIIDGSCMESILNHYRHQFQSDLLKQINGKKLVSRKLPNFDAIVTSIKEDKLDQYQVSPQKPRNLSRTRYGFQDIIFNGQKMNVYNNPIETNKSFIKKQGNSKYLMEGTCGLCQSANILTMAGITTTEDDIISIALHSSDNVLECMDIFNKNPDNRGGTTVNNRKEILESQGIPITNLPINSDRNFTVRQLASAVSSGHGVILSVDVEYLWRNGQSGGHAISLLSVTSDGNTFIYNDTGYGRISTISASDLALALTGRPANITTNIIR